MKKIAILIIIAIMVSAGFLSGCDESNADSDNDGYADDVDDFPNDANFHKKIIWETATNQPLESNEDFPEVQSIQHVTSSVKYVECNWSLVGSSPNLSYIEFSIKRRSNGDILTLYDVVAHGDADRIVVNTSNIGDWEFKWSYYPNPDQGWGTVYLTGSIWSVE